MCFNLLTCLVAYFALLVLCALLGLLFGFALFACFDLLCLVDLRSSHGGSFRFHEQNTTWIGIKLLFLDFGKIQNFGSELQLLYTFGIIFGNSPDLFFSKFSKLPVISDTFDMIFGKSPESGDFEILLVGPKLVRIFKPIRLVTSQKKIKTCQNIDTKL